MNGWNESTAKPGFLGAAMCWFAHWGGVSRDLSSWALIDSEL